jgi:hypothetical protein
MPTIDGRGHPIVDIIALARTHIPGVEVLFVEGFQSMAPASEGGKLYAMTSKFLLGVALTVEREKLTLIGSAHTPKTKENEGYLDLRQRVSGSAAWAAYTETVILIERVKPQDVYDNRRIMHLLPRNAREERFDFRIDDKGCFVETTNETSYFLLYNFLKSLVFDQDIFIETFRDFASEKSISRASLFRWFTDAIESGELERRETGIYRRRRRA